MAIVLFSATVLSVYWRLAVEQADESLKALSRTAVNVVANELAEHTSLEQAADEMEAVVRNPDIVVTVLDDSGRATRQMPIPLPIASAQPRSNVALMTVTADDGSRWRVAMRHAQASGQTYTVAIAAPMREVEEQWRTLVQASVLGIPFVLAIAAAGGWALGRRGLRPLAEIATQARNITARAPDNRLTIANAGAELDEVARSFNRVLDRLNSALMTQRRFMADASHELRTPVSIMATAADVTLSQPARNEYEYRDALRVVAQQSVRLGRLVDDMLVLARADAGGYPVVRAEVDLDAIVDGCVRDLASHAAAKQIRMTSRLLPATMIADETLLRRMLLNVLNNALTHTPTGGRVDVRMAAREGFFTILVEDTGPGIPLEDNERIFERFVRLDPARAEGGAGLGLAIARWIAEVHGGRVELLSSGSDGSVFGITLPA